MTLSPDIGDRIEVVLGRGTEHEFVHARGFLIAQHAGICFLHCDAIPPRGDSPGMAEWASTFRPDQVRRERTPADNLETLVARLSKEVVEAPKLRWFERRPTADVQRELDTATARAFIDHYRRTEPPPPNVADEIITETEDGLKRHDRVRIKIRGRQYTGLGVFIAEFRGLRHVIFDGGGPDAGPREDVTPLK